MRVLVSLFAIANLKKTAFAAVRINSEVQFEFVLKERVHMAVADLLIRLPLLVFILLPCPALPAVGLARLPSATPVANANLRLGSEPGGKSMPSYTA